MYTPPHHFRSNTARAPQPLAAPQPSTPVRPLLRVVHPLDDALEQKRFIPADAGRMHMSRTVRWSLGVLRAYLLLITVLVLVRVVQLAGLHG